MEDPQNILEKEQEKTKWDFENKLLKHLHRDPNEILAESKSYHNRMQERLDGGFYDEDIELALKTFNTYVECKHLIKEKMIVRLPKSNAIFSVGPGFLDLEKNEVYFNNISGECKDEQSLREYLIRRLS